MSAARFRAVFARLADERRCGLFPWLMAGFPDRDLSFALAETVLDAGADAVEIGVPFSDPLADGPTMQRANARALGAGSSLDTALDLARTLRERSADLPIALMSYYNPLLQRGLRLIAADLAAADVDGVIVADLPAEESGDLHAALSEHSIGLVPLISPTSPPERIRAVAAMDPVFIYCVALIGVTGARQQLAGGLAEFIARVRAETRAPQVIGFGISQPDHVRRVVELGVSGAIVASALADLVERSSDPLAAARAYLAELKAATRGTDALVSS